MTTEIRDLVTSYIEAVGDHRWEALPALVDPEVEFTFGDTHVRGAEAFVGSFERVSRVLLRNDIRKVFVDGDEACVIYDFVTDSPAGAVVCFEHIRVRNGRIAQILLVFERLHWAEVVAAIAALSAA
jgi:ketosteroid isomerase-like protein